MNGYVYILKDDRGRFYIGSTNIDSRLKAHRSKTTWTTARMKQPKLVLVQKYDSMRIARKVEDKIKRLKRKDYIEKMVQQGIIKMTI